MTAPVQNYGFPYFSPPPLRHPIAPPPPHIIPTPPAPTPSGGNTIIIVVFVSLGGLFFLAFLSVALCCFIKKKKKRTMVQKTEVIDIDEHLKVQEAIVPGPQGMHAVVLSVEDDVHIQEQIRKNEQIGEGSKVSLDTKSEEVGPSSSSSHHVIQHKH